MALPPTPPQSQPHSFSPIANRNTQIFQPPKSSASTAATPSYATSTDYFSHSGSRKRSRPDSSHTTRALPTDWTTTPTWAQSTATFSDSGLFSSDYGQNSLLVNERYNLIGGFDTPGLAITTELDKISDHRNNEARRWTRDRQPSFHASGPPLSGPLARERNGLARMHSSPNGATQPTSWTRFAFSLVGKAFIFGSSVFRGFYAGSGAAYNRDFFEKREGRPASSHEHHTRDRSSTPLPGSWTHEDFLGDFEQDNLRAYSPSAMRPPNKRRQTDKESWVLVGTPDIDSGSPRRKVSGNSAPRRTGSPAPRPSASRASSRRSLLPTPTHRRTPSAVSPSGSPERRASFAPTRSPGSRPSTSGRLDPFSNHSVGRPNISGRPSSAASGQGHLSPEAERYMKRQAKQDRKADKAMNSMGRQLEELIRQGQQALGTKVDVEDQDEDMGQDW